ncbi:hypothetical protein RHMOL_Rhmol07G0106400 [Rhododendron molle]|uniref:Uncharacterized protein n=1 Tax=Rhododendron molle TaxID=49168 RepID=A0ACC0N0L2_RHOML|nr:hypothetical protein RHMOL_Rhmol07G0106400 [Rhododendron molle]
MMHFQWEKMDSLHSNIRDWKARGGGSFYCRTKLDIELEGDRGDCNEAGGTSCPNQPTANYILHSEGTSYANVSLGSEVTLDDGAMNSLTPLASSISVGLIGVNIVSLFKWEEDISVILDYAKPRTANYE